MDAPDKIYCGSNGYGNLYFSSEKLKDSMTEYIRKDNLLEWLQEKSLCYMSPDTIQGYRHAIYEVIDKLNSL